MQLKILGSSSAGNCYILENNTSALIIEAGVKFSDVQRKLKFNIRKIVGVIVSHEHGDHAKYLHEFKRAGIPVFQSQECETGTKTKSNQILKHLEKIKIGEFGIIPFELNHDVLCYGFYIYHDEMEGLVFITDTSFVDECYRFKHVKTFMIECNYDDQTIFNNQLDHSDGFDYSRKAKERHLSLESAADFLSRQDKKITEQIILLHPSSGNCNQELSLNLIKSKFGIKTDFAKKKQTYEL